MSGRLAALARFAVRDLRVVFLDYRILVFCVAIGVCAVTGVNALTGAFLDGLARDGRVLLGGDLSLSRAQKPLEPAEREALARRGLVSESGALRAMARTAADEAALADVKGVEPNYPLAGAVRTEPAAAVAGLDADGEGGRTFGAWADPALLARLDLKVGDRILVGDAALVVRAVIVEEPDRLVAGAAFAPRLIVSRDGLAATGLLTPDSLVRWTVKLALPAGAAPGASDAALAEFRKAFPDAGFEARTRENASPQVTRIVDRVTKFLIVMGLLSVVVGGVGVRNAVALFVERQRPTAAILKTIGASGGFVFALAMTQILALAAAGVLLGVVAGSLIPFAFAPVLANAGFANFAPALSWRAIGGGAAVGFGAALVFSLIPAGAIHDAPGAILLRGDADERRTRPRARYVVAALVCLAVFILAVGLVAGDGRFGALVVLCALAFALAFDGAARLIALAVRNLPQPRGVASLAWSGLSRATPLSRAVVVSLGLGLIVLAATSGISSSLRAQLVESAPEVTPDLFLVGVPSKDAAAFRASVEAAVPGARLESAPLMRGRIVEVRGVPAEKAAARDNAAWVLDGDRGITFAREKPRDATIVEGAWWPADYDGPPLVSLGADAARGLGLHVGDEIAVNIAGRRIAAKIANLREINWASFGINFVLVFSPKPIEAAPHSVLFTAAAPALADPVRAAAFVKETSRRWPMVATIEVRALLDQARGVVDKVGLAVEASSLFTMIAAAVVLAGAVAADQRARARVATILKVLGGGRRQILFAALLEFAALGLATGLVAVLAGSAVAAAALKAFLDTPFVVSPLSLGGLVGGAVLAVAALGLSMNWRMLNEPAGRALRRI